MRYFAEKHVLVGKRPSEIVLDWFNQALWLLSKHFPTLSTHRLNFLPTLKITFVLFLWVIIFYLRALFNWASKEVQDCNGFATLCSVIGPENWHHHLNQSDAKLKTIATWSPRFPRFPRFRKFAHFHFEFSLANDYVNLWFWLVVGISLVLVFRNSIAALSFQPPIWLLRRFRCHDIQMKSAQKSTILRLTHLWLSKNDDHLITRIQAWYPGRPRV